MKTFLSIIVILILLILGGGVYFGFFEKVSFENQAIGPFEVVYKNTTGDYAKVGSLMDSISSTITQNGIQENQGIGVYFSDPKTTAKENLISSVGSVVSGMTLDQFNIMNLQDELLKRVVLANTQALVVTFPYRNKLSFMIGPIVVYPKIEKYMKENNMKAVPIMEIYDMENKRIQYVIVQDGDYFKELMK